MTELNGPRYTVANVAANTFELDGIDSTAYTTYTSGGEASSLYEIATPYAHTELFEIGYTQSADVLTLVHRGNAPRTLGRTGHTSWTLSTITFAPETQPPTGLSGTGSAYSYVVTSFYDDTGEESVASAAANMDETSTLSFTAPASGPVPDRYYVYKMKPANGLYGFIGEAVGTTFTDSTIIPDLEDTPPQARNPFAATDDYPSTVAYYQQRLAFGATNNDPDKVWLTQIGRFNNMNVSVPQKADDALTLRISSNEVNRVQNFAPLDSLIVLTSGAEHLVTSGDSAFSVDNIKIKPQDYRGSTALKPIILGGDILFVQGQGNVVRSMSYALESDSYRAQDLSILSRHLFVNNSMVDWSYANQPNNVLWCVRDDGSMLGFTFVREHEVFAWHRHKTDGLFESVATVGENKKDAVYVAVKRTIGGVTKRYIERMHERGFEGTHGVTDIEDAFFVDSGLSHDVPYIITGATQADPVVISVTSHPYSNGDTVHISDVDFTLDADGAADTGMAELNGGRYLVSNSTVNAFEITDLDGNDIDGTAFAAYTSGGIVREAVNTVAGLDHLEGETVAILADGDVHPQRVVASGSVTLDYRASRIHVGLPYNADVETLETPEGYGRKKTVSRIQLRFLNTRGIKAGPSLTRLNELVQRTDEDYAAPTRLFTGEAEIVIEPTWQNRGRLSFRQSDPLPFTLLAILPDVEAGG